MFLWQYVALFVIAPFWGGVAHGLPAEVGAPLSKERESSVSCERRLFCSLLSRQAEPEWVRIQVHGGSALIPYSSEWLIGLSGLSVYDIEDISQIHFGRPVDYLNTVLREYTIRRETNTSRWPPANEASCLGQSDQAQEVMVEGVAGILYFSGGAKWCSMVFTFKKEDNTYYIERNLEPFVTLHDIAPLNDGNWPVIEMDEEMKSLIKGFVPE